MRRLLDSAAWPWTDADPARVARPVQFARSGEALTSACLLAYAAIFLWPGSTFAVAPVLAWLRATSDGRPGPWAALALALAITGPLALWWDSGMLRILSLGSQAGFFLVLANAVRLGSPPGLLIATLALLGAWSAGRAATLARAHWRGGGGGGA